MNEDASGTVNSGGFYGWEATWGIGHNWPQMAFIHIIRLDVAEQREITEYYRQLHERVL